MKENKLQTYGIDRLVKRCFILVMTAAKIIAMKAAEEKSKHLCLSIMPSTFHVGIDNIDLVTLLHLQNEVHDVRPKR